MMIRYEAGADRSGSPLTFFARVESIVDNSIAYFNRYLTGEAIQDIRNEIIQYRHTI
jgi:hypothetical protein